MPSLNDLWTTFLNNGGAPTPSATAGALLGSSNTPLLLATPVQVGATGSRRLYTYNIQNPNAAVIFIQMFNKATAPTVGTDTPMDWIAVPAGGVIDGAWAVSPPFNLGLWIAATTTPNGAVAAATGAPVSLGFI